MRRPWGDEGIWCGRRSERTLDTYGVVSVLSRDGYDLIIVNGFDGNKIEFLSLFTKTLQREI